MKAARRQASLVPISLALAGASGLLWAAAGELLAHWARRNPLEAGLLRTTATRVAGEVRGVLPVGRRGG